MANWCDTHIVFFSDNTEQLGDFYNKLRTGKHNDLGSIAECFGIGRDKFPCRGAVYYISEIEDSRQFYIDQEDAWLPKITVWQEILKKNYPEINLVFRAEEPGCEIFINSDIEGDYISEEYYLDYCLPDTDYVTEFFNDKSSLILYGKKLFDDDSICTVSDIRSRAEAIIENSDDADDYFFSLYKYAKEAIYD